METFGNFIDKLKQTKYPPMTSVQRDMVLAGLDFIQNKGGVNRQDLMRKASQKLEEISMFLTQEEVKFIKNRLFGVPYDVRFGGRPEDFDSSIRWIKERVASSPVP
jgi:hypothetical protein